MFVSIILRSEAVLRLGRRARGARHVAALVLICVRLGRTVPSPIVLDHQPLNVLLLALGRTGELLLQ